MLGRPVSRYLHWIADPAPIIQQSAVDKAFGQDRCLL